MNIRQKTENRDFRTATMLATVFAVMHLLIWVNDIVSPFENFELSYLFRLRGPRPTPSEVAVVAIDEASYQRLGISKHALWPRQYQLELMKRLKELGAKRVAFDLVFRGVGLDPKIDQELAEAFKLVPVVLAHQEPENGETREEAPYVADELFLKSAVAPGSVEAYVENGAVLRFTPARGGSRSLSEAGAGEAPHGLPGTGDLINYYGPSGAIETTSFYRVIDRESPLPADYFKDKVVFVGASLGLSGYALARDWAATPFSRRPTFGVEINATQAANILRGDWIRRGAKGSEGLWLNWLVMGLAVVIFKLEPGRSLIFYLLLVPCLGAASRWSFERNLFVPVLSSLAVLFLAVSLNWVIYYLKERRNRRWIERAFGNYVPASIVKWLQADPGRLRREVHEIESAVLFTDIQGFTKWVESSPAEVIQPVMNAYSDAVEKCLDASEATLANTWGDAKFVIWGAPREVGDAAERAITAVLEIREELKKLRASAAIPDFVTRFGLNYGSYKVGNFGSSQRFQYTAYGDAVNFAARLESLNKEFGTDLFFTGALKERISERHDCFFMAKVVVAGKSKLADVYTIFDGAALAEDVRVLWMKAFEAFAGRRWDEAEALYQQAAGLEKRLEQAVATYQVYIAAFRDAAPEASWQGELVFGKK